MQCDVAQVSGTKVWNAFKEEKNRAHAFEIEEKTFTIGTAASLKHVRFYDIVLCHGK